MDLQQLAALAAVLLAGAYLAQAAVKSYQSFRADKGGCGSGCGKCGFAPKDNFQTPRRQNVIALSDVRPSRPAPPK